MFLGHFETKVLKIATRKEDVVEENDEQYRQGIKHI
jgi:hypothetical protein